MTKMLKFSQWLIIEESDLVPREKIGSGHFANVYATDDPNVVMRLEPLGNNGEVCEKVMASPKMQSTGGVVKILGSEIRNIDGKVYKVTYKERVNINWATILGSKYANLLKKKYNISSLLKMMHSGEETASKIGEVPAFIQLALEAFRTKETIIDFLSNFKEALGLIKAIKSGLAYNDLHSDNLGLNKEGNLVVIDC